MLPLLFLVAAQSPSVALVYGGGATPAEGTAWLARFEETRKEMTTFLRFGEGYPRVVASADVAGMKPGFHVVLLGVCASKEVGAAPLAIARTFFEGAYARDVSNGDSKSCPAVVDKAALAWTRSLKSSGADGLLLVVSEIDVERNDDPGGGESSMGATRSEIVAVLRSTKTGELKKLDVQAGDVERSSSGFGGACDLSFGDASAGFIRTVAVCSSATAECGTSESEYTTTWTISGGQIGKEKKQKELKPYFCIQ